MNHHSLKELFPGRDADLMHKEDGFRQGSNTAVPCPVAPQLLNQGGLAATGPTGQHYHCSI